MEQDRVHESKSNADRFIVSRYGQNVDEEEDARSCFVIVLPVVMFYVVSGYSVGGMKACLVGLGGTTAG